MRPEQLPAPDGVDPRFRVLGSLELDGPAAAASLVKSERLRRLLGALLVRLGQTVSADRLVDAVWPDAQPHDSRAALYSLAYRLRRVVDAVPEVSLRTTPPGYTLSVPRHLVDALRFEDLVVSARRDTVPERAAGLLDEALALWRGPAYAEFAEEEFARAEAARLAALHRSAVEQRAETALDLGRYDDAIARLEPILVEDPLDERPWRAMMIALQRLGRAAEALQTYRRFRSLSTSELGLEPSDHLKQLELAILRGDAADGLAPPEDSLALNGVRPVANLPNTSFVGREHDLAAVEAMLGAAPVVTLVGPGGVGKTRLAIEIARRVETRFPDGVLVCELAAITEEDQLLDVLAAAVQVVPDAGGQRERLVLEAMARRSGLLVLDNCEHVIDTAARVVDRLLTLRGDVQVLATSRERLGVGGEHVWPLDCLPVPEPGELASPSVTMFLDRARATNPRFHGAPEVVAEICRKLEGLPLAIELAAARTNGIAIQEILDRLDDQPELLRSPRDTRPPRHQSLIAVIEWSYDLLDPVDQEVFDRLSVLPGDFGLDAALAVVDAAVSPENAVRAVVSLAERSLIRHFDVGGRSRYEMLDSLRRFGRDRLRDRGGLAAARAMHARWSVERAEALDPTTSGFEDRWLELADPELRNFRAAQRFHIEHQDADGALRLTAALDCYAISSLRPEVYEWAQAALALPGAEAHPLAGTAHATLATGAWLGGDLRAARCRAERAVALVESTPGAPRRFALGAMAAVSTLEHDLAGGIRLYRRAVDAALTEGADAHALLFGLLMGSLLVHTGQVGEMDDRVPQLLHRALSSPSPHLRALAHMLDAELVIANDPAQALRRYWLAVEAAERSGSLYLAYSASMSTALCEAAYGDAVRSAATYRQLLHRWKGRLNDIHVVRVLRGVAKLLVTAGAHRDAARLSGAIGRSREMSYTMPEFDEIIDAALEQAEAALGADGYAAAEAEGRALSRARAVTLADEALSAVYPEPVAAL
ncbi:ATP-binding protein [Actinokineospora sp. 24-640]